MGTLVAALPPIGRWHQAHMSRRNRWRARDWREYAIKVLASAMRRRAQAINSPLRWYAARGGVGMLSGVGF